MKPISIGFLYMFAAFACFSLAYAHRTPAVTGADNCNQDCQETTYNDYECLHYNPTTPPVADCTKEVWVAKQAAGCIKNVGFMSFCSTATSGGACNTEAKTDVWLRQYYTTTGACTTTNTGGTWNRQVPGNCQFFHDNCTDYETTACGGSTAATPRSDTVQKCKAP